MKRNFRTSIMAALLVLAVTGAIWANGSDYGNAAATATMTSGALYTVPDMLRWAAEDASVKSLFEQLMRASENHLRAFRTQLSRY